MIKIKKNITFIELEGLIEKIHKKVDLYLLCKDYGFIGNLNINFMCYSENLKRKPKI